MNELPSKKTKLDPKDMRFEIMTGSLKITIGDMAYKDVSLRWLRLDCRCALCGESWSGKKWQTATDIPLDLSVRTLEKDPDGLAVIWSDGHQSHYGWAQLTEAYDQAPLPGQSHDAVGRLPLNLWDGRINQDLKAFDAERIKANGQDRYVALKELMQTGIVKITNVGFEMDDTRAVARLFGPIRTNSYGEIQDLISKPEARVAGETSNAQIPHTDEPFRYAPPGFIFFHAVRVGGGTDGTSLMTDGFYLAEYLKKTNPDAYACLSEKRVLFHREHAGSVFFEAEARAICLDGQGDITGIRFNDRCFGPQRGNVAEQDRIIAAFRAFSELAQDPANQLAYKIQPGEMLIFDNHRVMHGRMAFDPAKAVRHLRSCNVDRDEVHSAYRSLGRSFDPDIAHLRLYQGAVV